MMEPEITPEMLVYQNDYDRITEITDRSGARLTGHDARMHNLNEFVRVMSQADFNRDETPRDYSRTTDRISPPGAWSGHRHQTEHADAGALMLLGLGMDTPHPFSPAASQVLLFNPPRDLGSLGDDGTATV